MKRFFAILLVVISGCKPATSPSADLASPSQEVRDAAAKMLRDNAKPPSKLKWFFFTHRIKIGETQSNLFDLFRTYNLSTQSEFGIGGIGAYYEYRLDDYWHLGCVFNNDDYERLILEKWELKSGWRAVAVWPPTNFSGVWINYFANGQKFTECDYTNGLRNGDQITFYSDGQKASVDQFDHGVHTSFTSFFHSGRIYNQGQFSNHEPVGVWIDYNKDGSTNHVIDYSKPRTNTVISPN